MSTIITKRLRLSYLTIAPSHIQQIVGWLNDKEVVRYSEQRHHKHTVETQLDYIRHGPREYRDIIADDAFIGTLVAHIDENNSVANIGILIGEKKEWGKGYGTEAWQAFCDHLLGNGIRKIEAGAMINNSGMIRIFHKTGMFFEGKRIDHFLFKDDLIDLVQYARFI